MEETKKSATIYTLYTYHAKKWIGRHTIYFITTKDGLHCNAETQECHSSLPYSSCVLVLWPHGSNQGDSFWPGRHVVGYGIAEWQGRAACIRSLVAFRSAAATSHVRFHITMGPEKANIGSPRRGMGSNCIELRQSALGRHWRKIASHPVSSNLVYDFDDDDDDDTIFTNQLSLIFLVQEINFGNTGKMHWVPCVKKSRHVPEPQN